LVKYKFVSSVTLAVVSPVMLPVILPDTIKLPPRYRLPAIPAPPSTTNAPVLVFDEGAGPVAPRPDGAKIIEPDELNWYILYPPVTV
jgi:hypothetical protein